MNRTPNGHSWVLQQHEHIYTKLSMSLSDLATHLYLKHSRDRSHITITSALTLSMVFYGFGAHSSCSQANMTSVRCRSAPGWQ